MRGSIMQSAEMVQPGRPDPVDGVSSGHLGLARSRSSSQQMRTCCRPFVAGRSHSRLVERLGVSLRDAERMRSRPTCSMAPARTCSPTRAADLRTTVLLARLVGPRVAPRHHAAGTMRLADRDQDYPQVATLIPAHRPTAGGAGARGHRCVRLRDGPITASRTAYPARAIATACTRGRGSGRPTLRDQPGWVIASAWSTRSRGAS